jgi:IclR family acetate operon transcriptional repressor
MPAHSTGIGKAILAHLRPDELGHALPEKLEQRTPATITDRERLVRHLADIRRRGYSTDNVENEDGIRCVGAPVFDHSGRVCAGVSVAGPATRVTVDRFLELGGLVREAATAVSRRIGYVPEAAPAGLFEAG